MQTKTMMLSLLPWAVFSVAVHQLGPNGVGVAALLATGLAVFFTLRNRGPRGITVIDGTGILTFTVLAALALSGNPLVDGFVADFGRGASALVLGLVMLVSSVTVPFSEQYARQTVPREYWSSSVFREVNRRVSAVWALAVLIMGSGHLLAGVVAPQTSPTPGSRPLDLLLNWVLPVLLVLAAIHYTRRLSTVAGATHTEITVAS